VGKILINIAVLLSHHGGLCQ